MAGDAGELMIGLGLELLCEVVDGFGVAELENEGLEVETLNVVGAFDVVGIKEAENFGVEDSYASAALLVVLNSTVAREFVDLDEAVG